MSAQELADETERLGYPVSRSQIANYESGRKQGLDVAEFLILAAALDIPPALLLFPTFPDDTVEVLPGQQVDAEPLRRLAVRTRCPCDRAVHSGHRARRGGSAGWRVPRTASSACVDRWTCCRWTPWWPRRRKR